MNCRPIPSMVLLALASMPATSGPLYGTVRVGNAPAANFTLDIACPGFGAPSGSFSAKSDGSGSYSLLVRWSGQCEMRVSGNGRTGAPFPVFVSDNAVRFDFVLDGALTKVQ
jgi:hypothetical protein